MDVSNCAWAPGWKAEERQRFLSEVESVVGARFGDYELDAAEGTVTVSDLDCVFGLSNLAQTCRLADPEDWRLLVYSHITRLDDFAPAALAELMSDYERVKDDLRVRVVSQHHVAHIDPVADPLPLGLYSCLSVDLDGAAMPVDRGYFDGWGVDHDEVMAAAVANSLAADKLAVTESRELSGRFTVLAGDSLFATAHLLDLADSLPDVGPRGAVVTVPTAREVMVCAVDPPEDFESDGPAMLAASYARFLMGPNSVTSNALWWRPGEPLEGFARLDHGGFEVVAPPELREYLGLAIAKNADRSRAEGIDI
ncbi:MAG: hypothetical protein F4Y28_02215 [Acidimicrobiia bacterium]|nr:hypothetical protein [Acidimicrobiia bacterium]MYJ31738.1 hypothetical protein [Acidimicrobiia bacterium]